MPGLAGAAGRCRRSIGQAVRRTRHALLPGRALSVFLAALLLMLGLLSVGNFLTDGAIHATWLHNLVRHGSLEIVHVPEHYSVHGELLHADGQVYQGVRSRGLGYLSAPAWLVLGGLSLVGLQWSLPAVWAGLLFAWTRVDPAAEKRVSRRAAAGLAVGVFAANLVVADPISFALWGEMLAAQATNAVAVALAAAAVYRLARHRWRSEDAGLLAAALLVVGPVAFWGIGAKDHAVAVAGTAVALAGLYGHHRTGTWWHRPATYGVLALTVWVAEINGLVALLAVFVADLGATLGVGSRLRERAGDDASNRPALGRRAVAAGLVVALAAMAALPYPLAAVARDGAPIEAPTGTASRSSDPLASWSDRLTQPVADGVQRGWESWRRPDRAGASMADAAARGGTGAIAVPLLLISPALVAGIAALGRPAQRRGRTPPVDRVTVLEAGLAGLVLAHLFVYGPIAGRILPRAFDYRYLLVLYVPASILVAGALRRDLDGRAGRTVVLAAAGTAVLAAGLVAGLASVGVLDVVVLMRALKLVGLAALAGVVLAWAHDRLVGTGALPVAVALGLAVSGAWLVAATVVHRRGVADVAGGGFWLPLVERLHLLLA